MIEAIVAFVGIVMWMGMGGFAFADFMKHSDDEMKEMTFGIFLVCLILAPFVAAAVLASRLSKASQPQKGEK